MEVVTDQGGEFQGEFQALMDRCGIDHRLTSPYHPQANGLTERANQTLTKSLVKMTKEDLNNWDKKIPTVMMGYRATRQALTRYSPFYVLHGHEMVLPINNKGRTISANHGELSEELIANVFGHSKAVLEDVLSHIGNAQVKQMEMMSENSYMALCQHFQHQCQTRQAPQNCPLPPQLTRQLLRHLNLYPNLLPLQCLKTPL